MLKKIQPSIDKHYSRNRHHPEFHKNRFKDMTLLDKIEMIIDWKSAIKRHENGNIMRSININQKRFNYTEDDKKFFLKIVNWL